MWALMTVLVGVPVGVGCLYLAAPRCMRCSHRRECNRVCDAAKTSGAAVVVVNHGRNRPPI